MEEILAFILQTVLEVICESLTYGESARFWLPVIGGVAATVITSFINISESLHILFCSLSLVAGIVLGIIWQSRA